MPIDPVTMETVIEAFYEYRSDFIMPDRVEVTPAILGELSLMAVKEKVAMMGLHVPVVVNPDLGEPGWRIVFNPPERLYDEDGYLIAVKGHRSRSEVMREIGEQNEWVLDDIRLDNEDDRCRLRLSAVRELTEGFKHVWYRPADPANADEREMGFGLAAWWPCPEDHRYAEAYTATGLDG